MTARNTGVGMKAGEHRWDACGELRVRCRLSLRLNDGHSMFTAGKTPLATATLMPEGETLDVSICVDRVADLARGRERTNACKLSNDTLHGSSEAKRKELP